jgi:two-component system, OmpR family, phosphate regulon response regulator PhoB
MVGKTMLTVRFDQVRTELALATADRSTSILIVDDDPVRREWTAEVLARASIGMVETAETGAALEVLRFLRPDVLIVDWSFGASGCDEFVRNVRRNPTLSDVFLVVTCPAPSIDHRLLAFDAGADDCLITPIDARELVARLRAIARRMMGLAPIAALRVGRFFLEPDSHRIRVDGREISLPPALFRLLSHLIRNPERAIAREEFGACLWGQSTELNLRAVDVAFKRLRDVLKMYDCDDCVQTIRRVGYRLVP